MTDVTPTPPRQPPPIVALLVLGGGSLGACIGLCLICVFYSLPPAAATLVTGIAQGMLSIVTLVAGYYFGSAYSKQEPSS